MTIDNLFFMQASLSFVMVGIGSVLIFYESDETKFVIGTSMISSIVGYWLPNPNRTSIRSSLRRTHNDEEKSRGCCGWCCPQKNSEEEHDDGAQDLDDLLEKLNRPGEITMNDSSIYDGPPEPSELEETSEIIKPTEASDHVTKFIISQSDSESISSEWSSNTESSDIEDISNSMGPSHSNSKPLMELQEPERSATESSENCASRPLNDPSKSHGGEIVETPFDTQKSAGLSKLFRTASVEPVKKGITDEMKLILFQQMMRNIQIAASSTNEENVETTVSDNNEVEELDDSDHSNIIHEIREDTPKKPRFLGNFGDHISIQ